jgi:hypothetical protein
MLPTLDGLPPDLTAYLNGLPPMMRAGAMWLFSRNPGMVQKWQQAHPGATSKQLTDVSYTNPFLNVRTGGPVVSPFARPSGPDPTRPLSQDATGGPLPPTQTIPRAGGLLRTRSPVPASAGGNTGIVPPTMSGQQGQSPMGESRPQIPRAPMLPAVASPRAVQASAGLPAPTASPTGRPALLRPPRLG